ncbi:MAG TPA: hypothetical protein VHF25_03900 [Nitriliruptorales bacterium]|nr:hypothetical protein [Nitriliruptorales bacterium]
MPPRSEPDRRLTRREVLLASTTAGMAVAWTRPTLHSVRVLAATGSPAPRETPPRTQETPRPSPTETAPGEVRGSEQARPPGSRPTEQPPQVAPLVIERPVLAAPSPPAPAGGPTADVAGKKLARTGIDPRALAGLGGALAAGGYALRRAIAPRSETDSEEETAEEDTPTTA